MGVLDWRWRGGGRCGIRNALESAAMKKKAVPRRTRNESAARRLQHRVWGEEKKREFFLTKSRAHGLIPRISPIVLGGTSGVGRPFGRRPRTFFALLPAGLRAARRWWLSLKNTVILNGVSPWAKAGAKRSEESLTLRGRRRSGELCAPSLPPPPPITVSDSSPHSRPPSPAGNGVQNDRVFSN